MKTFTTLFFIVTLCSCNGQKDMVYSTKAGAIAGYDPVSYFISQMPMKGSDAFTYMWKGAKWYFASEKNRAVFKEDPEAYAPQYGGYCAYAISQGYTAKIDPNSWKIVEGKLYLNYNANIQSKWEENQDEYIMYADSNWPKVLEE